MSEHTVIILVTFFGFILLAALLLIPVYRFLKREESLSETWTPERLEAERLAYEAEQARRSEDEAA